jgi:hypothetical protein
VKGGKNMSKPREPYHMWIDKEGLKYSNENSTEQLVEKIPAASYSALKSSVYPHSGQEKASKSLP